MGSAPRHLTLNHPESVDKGKRSYPNIAMEDSDAQTILIASFFGAKYLGLIKRTDQPYMFDPYKNHEKGLDSWREVQKNNSGLGFVKHDELLMRETQNGKPVLRIGQDGQDEHLFEDSALKLFGKSSLEGIYIVHIDPLELYIDRNHVITNKALTNLDSREVRNNMLLNIIEGKPEAGIIR